MDELSTAQTWFLRKHEDGTVFGPLTFERLARWAADAQVAPHDTVSNDQQTWIKAPMLPELGMDWLVEITTEHYYGPTTLGAIQEFIRLGEINEETFVINACDGTRRQIHEMIDLLETAQRNEPAASGISINLHDRIRDLEQSLSEERRALEEAEQRYAELEREYRQLLQERQTEA
ncbi:MAG TPA: hypothetical protein VEI58_05940 [Chthoniobacterales bacterium]|nr:hypothetical protein [Chthoniobacterales bacterium]